jgi:hypothetical protein
MAVVTRMYSADDPLTVVPDDAIVTIESAGVFYYAYKSDFLSELIEHTRFVYEEETYEYSFSLDVDGNVQFNYTLVV